MTGNAKRRTRNVSALKATCVPSDALVLFGITGDLAYKMTFPALYAMARRGDLKVPLIGVASSKWTVAQLHKHATDSIREERQDRLTERRSVIFCRCSPM